MYKRNRLGQSILLATNLLLKWYHNQNNKVLIQGKCFVD